jgi:hypothetical protein
MSLGLVLVTKFVGFLGTKFNSLTPDLIRDTESANRKDPTEYRRVRLWTAQTLEALFRITDVYPGLCVMFVLSCIGRGTVMDYPPSKGILLMPKNSLFQN